MSWAEQMRAALLRQREIIDAIERAILRSQA